MNRSSVFSSCLMAITLLPISLGLNLTATAHADEIWLEPQKEAANSKTGNWPTTNLGGWLSHGKETHFAFHVPDTFVSFTKAYLVLIPDSSSRLDTEVKVNVARKGQPHYWNERTDYLSQAVAKNVLTEMDITSTLRNARGGFAPSDYVTVNFKLRGYYEHTRVVGLRFQFKAADASVAGASCPAGQVVTGFDASGTVQCAVDRDTDTRAQGSCASGEVIRAINSNGTVTCVADLDTDMHVKGTSCPAGEVLTGYDDSGTPQCVSISGALEGGFPCTEGGTPVGDRWVLSESGLTVCDKNSGYTWQQRPLSTERTWQGSLDYCPTLGPGWELASRDVLLMIVDTSSSTCTGGASSLCLPDGHPFDNVQSSPGYWSATEFSGNPADAVFVHFLNGGVGHANKTLSTLAWCARSP